MTSNALLNATFGRVKNVLVRNAHRTQTGRVVDVFQPLKRHFRFPHLACKNFAKFEDFTSKQGGNILVG